MAVGIALSDVHPGDGGFCCIPGSHKRNFLPPDNSDERLRGQSLWGDGVPEIDIYDGPPTVANLCPKAGSCIIFTEALRVRLTDNPLPLRSSSLLLALRVRLALAACPKPKRTPRCLYSPSARCPPVMSFAACTR